MRFVYNLFNIRHLFQIKTLLNFFTKLRKLTCALRRKGWASRDCRLCYKVQLKAQRWLVELIRPAYWLKLFLWVIIGLWCSARRMPNWTVIRGTFFWGTYWAEKSFLVLTRKRTKTHRGVDFFRSVRCCFFFSLIFRYFETSNLGVCTFLCRDLEWLCPIWLIAYKRVKFEVDRSAGNIGQNYLGN